MPVIAWSAVVELNVTVPVPGVNVAPLLVQSPAMLMLAGAVNVPAVKVNPPFNVSVVVDPPQDNARPDLFIMMLLKVCDAAEPLIAWSAEVESKVTVPVPGVKVPPLLVQSPAMLMLAGAVNVPAVKVNPPFKVSVVVAPPHDNARPDLLTTMLLNV